MSLDLIKRHALRHHPEAVLESLEQPTLEQRDRAQVELDLPTSIPQRPELGDSSDKSGTNVAQTSPPPLEPASPASASATGSRESSTPASLSQPKQSMPDLPSPATPFDMDTFMAGIDLNDIQAFHTGSMLDAELVQRLNVTPALQNFSCSPLSFTQNIIDSSGASQATATILRQSSWHGSLKLSEAKHDDIAKETKKMDSFVGTNNLTPSA
ncbi:hypothetical protein H2198_006639 [Neophaeococcomyces mojaviensis]|uniref:Uncharacterized protein n=1 Tax=Neophaeococcomyces mojaviensis TaxID=3383035 RepID=A0ACC3A2D4_9EURO|nr:hypothetical protein H2198_006639 [Knufia sp. JES_112]